MLNDISVLKKMPEVFQAFSFLTSKATLGQTQFRQDNITGPNLPQRQE